MDVTYIPKPNYCFSVTVSPYVQSVLSFFSFTESENLSILGKNSFEILFAELQCHFVLLSFFTVVLILTSS